MKQTSTISHSHPPSRSGVNGMSSLDQESNIEERTERKSREEKQTPSISHPQNRSGLNGMSSSLDQDSNPRNRSGVNGISSSSSDKESNSEERTERKNREERTERRNREEKNREERTTNTRTSTEKNPVKNERLKSVLPKIFSSKGKSRKDADDDEFQNIHRADLDKRFNSTRTNLNDNTPTITKSFSESHANTRIEGLNLSNYDPYKNKISKAQEFRIFVTTWNVGGRCPHGGFNLEDFLQVEESSDIYVVGFQEIVPLSAGNVLVQEDSEPALRWLSFISQALNMPIGDDGRDDLSCPSQRPPNSQKPSLKAISKSLRAESALLKTCNCNSETMSQRRKTIREVMQGPEEDALPPSYSISEMLAPNNYSMIASKQMVGLFLSVWVRNELIPHIGHVRLSNLGRGIMGCLGNKGCIALSMTIHRTSFCFVCCHLASGEKEGDELKRNADVAEILKNIQFPNICKNTRNQIPSAILEHDQVIWLGDLNYRISLSYEEARVLLEDNDWDALLRRDQLIIEKEAGRVFKGWKEGKILFAPTYKYSHNSDSYAGETVKSKKKRRTPAWCDRILWYGNGMEQLSYTRGESRFSDHRPVCAILASGIELPSNDKGDRKKPFYSAGEHIQVNDCMPQRHSFYEY